MNTNPDDRSTNFDDLLLELQQEQQPEQSKPTTLEPYDKDAYKERKQAERDEAYRLADITAERAASSGEEYAKYLNEILKLTPDDTFVKDRLAGIEREMGNKQ